MEWTIKVAFEGHPESLYRSIATSAQAVRDFGREIDSVDRKVAELDRRRLNLKVDQSGLQAARAELSGLDGKRLSSHVSVDARQVGEARSSVDGLDRDLQSLYGFTHVESKEAQAAKREITDLRNELRKVDERHKVNIDSSDADKAERHVEGLNGGLRKAGTAVVALGAAMGGLTFKGLEAVDTKMNAQVGLEGIIQNAPVAKALYAEMVDFAAKTPFEITGLQGSVQQLLAMNQSVDQVIPDMQAIGGIAAVLGRGTDAIQGTVIALSQMHGKGKAMAQEMNQISEQLPGFNARAAIAASRGESVAQTMKAMEDGTVNADDAIRAILDGMAKFPGAADAMARKSETLSGRMSTLKDVTHAALADAFQGAVPAANRGLDDMTALVESRLPRIAQTLASGLGPIERIGATFALGGADGLIQFLDRAQAALARSEPAFRKFAELLPELGHLAGSVAALGLDGIGTAADGARIALNPTMFILKELVGVINMLPAPLRGVAVDAAAMGVAMSRSGKSVGDIAATVRKAFSPEAFAAAGRAVDSIGLKASNGLNQMGSLGQKAGDALADASGKAGGMVSSLGQVPIVGVAAVGALVGLVAVWQDIEAASKAADLAGRQFASQINKDLRDGGNLADVYAKQFSDANSEMGKIIQQPEFKLAMSSLGITMDDFAKASARSGTEGQLMFQRIATEASHFDSVMETLAGNGTDLDDGMQRMKKSSTEWLGSLTRGGGEYAGVVKEIIAEQKKLLSDGKNTKFVQSMDGDELRKLEAAGQVIKEIRAGRHDKHDVVIRTTGVDDVRLAAGVMKEMAARGIEVDEATGRITGHSAGLDELAQKFGLNADKLAQMSAEEQKAQIAQAQLTQVVTDSQTAVDKAGLAVSQTGLHFGEFSAAVRDGTVTQAEASDLMSRFGLTAEQVSAGMSAAAQNQAKTISELAGQLPTLSDALGVLQMNADNFSLEHLIEEQRKLFEANLKLLDHMTMLQSAGLSNIVAQIQQMPEQIRGVAAQQFTEMLKVDPDQAKEIEASFAAQGQASGEAYARLVNAGGGQIDLQGPMSVQAQAARQTLTSTFASPVPAPVTAVASTVSAESALQLVARGRVSPIDGQASTVGAERALNDTSRPRVSPIDGRASTANAERALNDTSRPRESVIDGRAQTVTAEDLLNNTARQRQAEVWARADVSSASNALNDLTQPRTVQINTQVAGANWVNFRFGGIRQARRGLIAPDGAEMIRFAERGTGGEAFIPRNIPRSSAKALLDVPAAWHGYSVVDSRAVYPSIPVSGGNGGGGGVSVSVTVPVTVQAAGGSTADMARAMEQAVNTPTFRQAVERVVIGAVRR